MPYNPRKSKGNRILAMLPIFLFICMLIPPPAAATTYTIGEVVAAETFTTEIKGVACDYDGATFIRTAYLDGNADYIKRLDTDLSELMSGASQKFYTDGIGALKVVDDSPGKLFVAGFFNYIIYDNYPGIREINSRTSTLGDWGVPYVFGGSHSDFIFIKDIIFFGDKILITTNRMADGKYYYNAADYPPGWPAEFSGIAEWGGTQPQIVKMTSGQFVIYDDTEGAFTGEKDSETELTALSVYPTAAERLSNVNLVYSDSNGLCTVNTESFINATQNSNAGLMELEKIFVSGDYIYGIKGSHIYIVNQTGYGIKNDINLVGNASSFDSYDITKDGNFMVLSYGTHLIKVALTGLSDEEEPGGGISGEIDEEGTYVVDLTWLADYIGTDAVLLRLIFTFIIHIILAGALAWLSKPKAFYGLMAGCILASIISVYVGFVGWPVLLIEGILLVILVVREV